MAELASKVAKTNGAILMGNEQYELNYKDMKGMSQEERVLEYLKAKGSITIKEALNELGVWSVSSRISRLRNHMGVKIIKTWRECHNRWGEPYKIREYRYDYENNK